MTDRLVTARELADRLGLTPGTVLEQIDRTYGHLLPDALDRARVPSTFSWQGPTSWWRNDRSEHS